MSWVDDNIPNSGGTFSYWISLVDRVGNESTVQTATTSQHFVAIKEQSIDPEIGLPIP
jgi:hypothetical protein